MSEPCTGHGLYLSGLFAIEDQLTEDMNYKVEFRTFSTSITCQSDTPGENVQYDIRATGYSTKELQLVPGNLYFLRGSFFPTNTRDTHDGELLFEGSDSALIGSVEDYPEGLADKVGITGMGRVTEVDFYVEDHMQYLKRNASDPDKITLYAIVQHCDFHPESKDSTPMTVEYHVPPFKHLAGVPHIVKVGRECQFHGYVKDFNEETNRYIVIVNKVAPTSGHVESTGRKKAVKVGSQTPGAKPRATKFSARDVNTPFKSPVITSGSGSSTAFGGPEHVLSSLSPGTAKSTDAPACQPPKKKARAQPKRKATKVIPSGSDET